MSASGMYESRTWANAIDKVPVLAAEKMIQKLTQYLESDGIDISVDDSVELGEVIDFLKQQAVDLQFARSEVESHKQMVLELRREITAREQQAKVAVYERVTSLMFRNPTFQTERVLNRNGRGELVGETRMERAGRLHPEQPDEEIYEG